MALTDGQKRLLAGKLGEDGAQALDDAFVESGDSPTFTTLEVTGLATLGDVVTDDITCDDITCDDILAQASAVSVTINGTGGTSSLSLTATGGGCSIDMAGASGNTITMVSADATNSLTTVVSNAQVSVTVLSATGEYSEVLTANLADAKSITDGVGDLIVFDTRTNARVLTLMGGVSTDTIAIGQAITNKVGFYGTAAIAQRAGASQAALNAYGAGANGLDSGANMSALHALVVEIRATLVALGLMKGAA